MADINSSSLAPPTTSFTLESDHISTLLHSFLQSSSLPSFTCFASATASTPPPIHPRTGESRRCFVGLMAFSDLVGAVGSSGSGRYAPEECERAGSMFPGAIVSSTAGRIGDFNCQSERDHEASEMLRNPTPASRSSSKRNRAAEIHNLSERRRRQRINEKMKALQKLIPNSNKMLPMRNGSSLHPFYLPAGMHTAQSTQVGTAFNNGDGGVPTSTSEGTGSISAKQELPFSNLYAPSNQCASSDQKIHLPKPVAWTSNTERPSGVESSIAAHCRPFIFNMPSKELCADSESPQLQLDMMSRCGDESLSGVSSLAW